MQYGAFCLELSGGENFIVINENIHLSSVPQYDGLSSRERVADILQRISRLKVGVVGDGCLDVYWHADMTISELSRETPHHNMPIVKEHVSPGAAANVAANYKDLGCAEVYFCSVIGNDWRGMMLQESFRQLGIDSGFVFVSNHRVTPAYCKTIRFGLQNVQQEDPRIDFINNADLTESEMEQMVAKLDRMAEKVDVISVTDQLNFGVVSSIVRDRLQYWAKQGKLIVADSRARIGLYEGLIVKPNELEALRWYYGNSKYPHPTDDDLIKAGIHLSRSVGAPCCMTLGERGALWFEREHCTFVPTESVHPPIDIVGAGDCFMTSLLSALGAGCSGPEAIAFAHLGAAVSVRKIGQTGTATPEEIIARFDEINTLRLPSGKA